MATDDDRWKDLCAEYRKPDRNGKPGRIGRGWLDVVFEVCSKIAPNYPPDVYNYGLVWDESSIWDLVQDVVLKRLLGDAQIDYIVASVSTLGAARGLIGKHVKQVLAHRVIPNQRDNVARRLYSLFEQRGEEVETRDGVGWLPRGSGAGPADPTSESMASAVRIICSLRRLPNRGTDRLSPLFTTEVLESAVEPLWSALGVPVTLSLLRRILEQALTGMTPVLFQIGEDIDRLEIGGLSTEEMVLVDDLAKGLVTTLTAEQREILVNVGILTDAELAATLGVSRPTALKRRHETRDLIAEYFNQAGVEGLSDQLQGAVLVQAQALLGGRYG